ncbi:uncharacterized protein BDZ99DRAFT_460623 [Mytilinidion resinicola]|uniref:Uncharacterized protein n=1 Tax=Mytilinidion resinicola TaxID=574789 RepID=A0A6A6YWQ3_9PEZI|nr:uncharacterized protein BDZ99DRAFT_460623 [Mytilinidion resinicola]KAF2813372.1 hypothetical protein BDZ99DRAFT_460623 [Mytilinidion resinicola]
MILRPASPGRGNSIRLIRKPWQVPHWQTRVSPNALSQSLGFLPDTFLKPRPPPPPPRASRLAPHRCAKPLKVKNKHCSNKQDP